MTFSARDQHILAQTGLRADRSLRELARFTGYQLHTVRHALERLRDRGVIHKVWAIDVFRLGWLRFQIFFSTGLQRHDRKAKLIDFLKGSEQVAFLAETGGDFDYEMVLLVRDIAAALDFLRSLTARFGDVFLRKAIVSHQALALFPRKYLAQKPLKPQSLMMGRVSEERSLDAADHRILAGLAHEPDITQRELARRIGCSEPTVKARLVRLRREGIITGAVYSVDSATFGAQNHILLLSVRGFEQTTRDSLFRLVEKHPNCTSLRECFGSWDFELGVEVRRYSELVTFKEELGDRFGAHLQNLEVLSRFKVHKYVLYPFSADGTVWQRHEAR